MKYGLMSAVGNLQFAGMDIYQGMLAVTVGTATVIREITRYKGV